MKDMLDNYAGYDSENEYEFVYDFENNKITIYSDIDMKHDGDEFSRIDYDIETMKKILKENDLTVDEITSLNFNDVKKYVDE